MARRTSSSKGASGISRLPRTPPLFLIAVRMSSSLSSLQQRRPPALTLLLPNAEPGPAWVAEQGTSAAAIKEARLPAYPIT